MFWDTSKAIIWTNADPKNSFHAFAKILKMLILFLFAFPEISKRIQLIKKKTVIQADDLESIQKCI